MDDESFERLIRDNLPEFHRDDPKNVANAHYVEKALKLWNREKEEYSGHFMDWWKKQDLQYVAALQTYLFYLWTVKKR